MEIFCGLKMYSELFRLFSYCVIQGNTPAVIPTAPWNTGGLAVHPPAAGMDSYVWLL